MKILITGAAGFIGFHAVRFFVQNGYEVVGLDNINDYYDTELKYNRLAETGINKEHIGENEVVESRLFSNYRFVKADLVDPVSLNSFFTDEQFDFVCHLAAQAGVRYSLNDPMAYINSNITGFLNVLEACRYFHVKHLVYASSSSVYGLNEKVPFSEEDKVDLPVSLYAASKKTNELMAHVYSKLYQVPTTGLRFFTVYGPWGRPDMAPVLFMKSILNHKPIKVFNHGKLSRDFTYIDDIISGLAAVLPHAPEKDLPYAIYNIGNGQPVELMDFIGTIENVTGKKAIKNLVEMQKGDVMHTFADTQLLQNKFGYKPQTSLQVGIDKLYHWYISYYSKQTKTEPLNSY